MKTLVIIRHAKSDWGNEQTEDFFRPLNARGNTDAPLMAERMKKRKYLPDLLLTSPAIRAYTTCLYFAKIFSIRALAISLNENLYDTGAEKYLEQINKLDEAHKTVFLFGHNPAVTEICSRLGNLTTDNVPTCGIAAFSFDSQYWKNIDAGKGRLLHYEFPKKTEE